MADKIELEQSETPPACPHCKATLTSMRWHKVKGGPWVLSYIALVSCPHCQRLLGAIAS